MKPRKSKHVPKKRFHYQELKRVSNRIWDWILMRAVCMVLDVVKGNRFAAQRMENKALKKEVKELKKAMTWQGKTCTLCKFWEMEVNRDGAIAIYCHEGCYNKDKNFPAWVAISNPVDGFRKNIRVGCDEFKRDSINE